MGKAKLNPVQDAFNILRLTALGSVVGLELGGVLDDLVHGKGPQLRPAPEWLARYIVEQVGPAEEAIGKAILDSLLSFGPQLTLSDDPSDQAGQAVRMLHRLLGFAAGLPLATGEATAALDALLGEHAPKGIREALERLPEELGINFFIGTVLERIFETAVATPLDEAIAQQTHPARMQWQQIRALLKAHELTEEEARGYLDRQGWRPFDAERLLRLTDVQLALGDIQQAFLLGIRSEEWCRDRLDRLGLDPEAVDVVVQLYLEKAETQGAAMLRSTLHAGALNGDITLEQFRTGLASINVPPKSIELEAESVQLQLGWRAHQLSVAEVHRLVNTGQLDDHQAIQRLVLRNYSEEDALALVLSWHEAKKAGHPGLTEQRILSYLVSGVLGKDRAHQLLTELGMRSEDAVLLVDHPEAYGGLYRYERTPALVLQAIKDDVLDVEEGRAQLLALGMDPVAADLNLRVLAAKLVRGKKPKQATKTLSEGQVLDAVKYGTATAAWAVAELVVIGYTDAEAQLLVATEQAKLGGHVPDGWVPLGAEQALAPAGAAGA